MNIYINIRMHVYIYTCKYMCMYIYRYIYTCKYMCMYIYTCICVHIYIYIYVCVYVYTHIYICIHRVSNPIPGIMVCDPKPRILQIEIPSMGSCSRSARWVWDRPEGGCHTPLLQCRTLYLHTGLMHPNTR